MSPNITHSFAESCESKIGSNFKGKRKWYQACAARNRFQILTKSESGSCMNACHAKRAMLKRGDSCLWQESQMLGAENLTHLAHINRHIKGQLNYLAPFTLKAYFEICLFINRKQHNFFWKIHPPQKSDIFIPQKRMKKTLTYQKVKRLSLRSFMFHIGERCCILRSPK